MILYLLSVGFVSILAQVVILRELNVAFFGVELIYIVAIAVWMLWTAAGALIGRRSATVSSAGVGYLVVAFSVLLPADVALVRALRVISGGVPGAYLPFGVQIAGVLVALLPVGVVLGVLFQWAARIYIGESRTLARAYAIESIGGLFGGIAATLFLELGLQNFMIAVVCSAVALGAVLGSVASRGRARPAAGAALVVILILAFTGARTDRALTRLTHPTLVASRDSPYSRITVTRQGEQFILFENDALAFETQSVTSEEITHLAASHVDSLRRVLILGGGVEGTVSEVLKYSPQLVDYVELNPAIISLTERFVPPSYWGALRSTSVHVVTADPRRFVREAKTRYDLILVGAPDPTSGQSNRFYTREFFALCCRILAPRGVLALRLRSSENVWTPFLTFRNAGIYRALKAVFNDVVITPGSTNVIVASDVPLSRDPAFLAKRLGLRRIPTRLVTPQYVLYLNTNDRFFEIAHLLSKTDVPPNTDVRPVCYSYSSMIWLSKFFPRLITMDPGTAGSVVRKSAFVAALAVPVLCVFFAVVRRRVRFQRVVMAALAGFIGMILETVLVLHYQVTSGILYQNLGVLLTAFMGGLAAGAGAASKATRNDAGKPLQMRKIYGYACFGGFAVLSALLAVSLRLGLPADLPFVSVLLFAAGFLVAGMFAYASRLGADDQRQLVSPLYAADLLGGCVACVAGSMFLVPFVGMDASAGAVAVLSLVALAVV